MNASKLLKAVLRPRALQNNVGRTPTATTDGPSSRRSLSPDSRLPASTLSSKRSSTPVKMTCMCSPTNHPGSFRCKYHRAQAARQAAVVALPSSPRRKAATRDSDILSEVNRCLPGMQPSTSRSTTVRCSRLKNMTYGSGLEEEEEALALSYNREFVRNFNSPVDCASTTASSRGPSRSAPQLKKDLPREIPTMFCQSTSRKALDAFDRNLSRMYL